MASLRLVKTKIEAIGHYWRNLHIKRQGVTYIAIRVARTCRRVSRQIDKVQGLWGVLLGIVESET